MTRSLALRATIAAALCLATLGIAHAQTYPAKPVRIIVPYPAGDAGDVIARLVAPKMSDTLGQQVIVDNRAGASGQIGLDAAARSPADGYTIAIGQVGNVVLAPHTYRKVAYDPLKDLVPVALLTLNYAALVTNTSTPYASVKDLVTHAKANPGKLTFASNGEGGFPHLAFEQLRVGAGFTYVHVPYKGSASLMSDLIGGQVDTAIAAYTTVAPQVAAGKLRLLAITNPSRVPLLPNVPSLGETVPSYDARGWFGALAPTGVPREVIARLNDAFNRALKTPDVSEKLTTAGLIIVTESPEYFGDFIRAEYAKYGKLVKDIDFKPQ